MILTTEKIEEYLKHLLQKNILITVRDRKLTSGKLMVYKIDGFYIQLTIYAGDAISNIDIPYPFNIKQYDNMIELDYRLESLSENDYSLLFTLQSISKKKESKFYNSILRITHI